MSIHSLLNNFNDQILSFVEDRSEMLVLILDADRGITYANRKALNMLGNDILEKTLTQLLVEFHQPVDLNVSPQRLQMSTTSGLPQAYDVYIFQQKDQYLLCASVNTTELEYLKKELIDTNNQLNNVMRELHKKNAELSQLNELKNRFVGIVAHDLKSPLNGMSMLCDYVEMDFEKLSKPKISDYLNMISGQIRFMVELINDILDLSAIESGILKLNLTWCDLMKLITECLNFHQLACDAESIQMTTDFHKSSHEMLVDKVKIRQAIDNILVNSMKFTKEGGVVSISTTQDDGQIDIHISDEGPGIAEEDLPHVFMPFRQAKSAEEIEAKGTGLGLAIVQKIIETHQGNVSVKNNPEKGCTFTLTIPEEGVINE